MGFHNLTRSLAIAGVIAIGIRWSQVHSGLARNPHWITWIPEWPILLLVLAALLFTPVLVLTEFLTYRPRSNRRPFWVDLAFIAITYVCFLFYMRYA